MSESARRKSPKAASSKRPDQRSDPKLQPKPLYRSKPPKPANTELVHATPLAPAHFELRDDGEILGGTTSTSSQTSSTASHPSRKDGDAVERVPPNLLFRSDA